jgi:type I restriction enzyme S subunit
VTWRETTLGALCLEGGGGIQTGPFGSQLHASDYVLTGVPSVMPQNIGDNVINAEGIARIQESDAERLGRYRMRSGDIVYSRRGDVEKRALVRDSNDGWLCGTGCLRVRLGDNSIHDPAFVSYLLGTEESREWIVRHAVGATMPNLNTSILSAVPLEVPEPCEQHAIAEVLGALDDKIAANTKLTSTIDEFLGSRFLHLLREHCATVRLGDIAEVNSTTVKQTSGGQLRYIDIASVGVGSYEFPELSGWEEAPSRARRGVRRGDTLWSTVRPNRRSHALNLSKDALLVGSTGLAVITPKAVGWAYLYEATRRPEFTAYLETVAEGSAYPAVRADKFEDAPVPFLLEENRQLFESLAEPLRESAHSLSEENRSLTATRDALLPQLMSGKLRVKDAEKVLENAGV